MVETDDNFGHVVTAVMCEKCGVVCAVCGTQAAKSPAQIAIENGYYAQRAMKAEARVEELEAQLKITHKLVEALRGSVRHYSDCALHNAPAYDPGPCDCGTVKD